MINIDVDHFRGRVVQDALTEATAYYWDRRAETFLSAAPRSEDFTGQSTPGDLQRARRRCLETATACRRRAQLIRAGLSDRQHAAEVAQVLLEIA